MEALCKSIASLPQSADREKVKSSIEPLIEKELSVRNGKSLQPITSLYQTSNCRAVRVTPLMIACDKSQIKCLEYLHDALREKSQMNQNDVDEGKQPKSGEGLLAFLGNYVIGLPTDISPDCNNQAIHYVAMSCCPEAGMVLAKIYGLYNSMDHRKRSSSDNNDDENTRSDVNVTNQKVSMFHNLIEILCQQNSHGDSAFMMASFQGKSSMLEEWIKTLLTLAHHEKLSVKESLISIRQVTNLANESGDSCLSIAVGHAHVDVVDCLIKEREFWVEDNENLVECNDVMKEGIVLVNQNDIKKAKGLMDEIDSLSSVVFSKNWDTIGKITAIPDNRDTIGRIIVIPDDKKQILQAKVQNTRRCLVMLQVSIAKLADKRSSELLESLQILEDKTIMNQKKHLKISNKIHGKTKKIDDECGEPKEEEEGTQFDKDASPGSTETNTFSKPAFKTLNDGTIVPSDDQSQHVQHQSDNYITIRKDEKSIEILMKERCLQSTISSLQDELNGGTSEAILESLCMDASMLLFSSQKMAMELSPSQLDVVETVLHQQLEAVVSARQIHKRLMTHMKIDSSAKE